MSIKKRSTKSLYGDLERVIIGGMILVAVQLISQLLSNKANDHIDRRRHRGEYVDFEEV